MAFAICTPKRLPQRLLIAAARNAVECCPVNAPAPGLVLPPAKIAVLTSKYWGAASRTLTVSFMESATADLRARIIGHLNAWRCGIRFAWTSRSGQIRISRGRGGYYSYLGTDNLMIPVGQQTMNLEGFTMATPESEFRRVIRHEAGHAIGFPHEHMRRELVAKIDPAKAYSYFARTQGWDRAAVNAQVLTPLSLASIMGTPADQTSCMCYQLPGSITRDGRPIVGGDNINATDAAFAQRIYPN